MNWRRSHASPTVARAAALAVVLAVAASGAASRSVLAESTSFGAPSATSTYLEGITFVQPVVLAAAPKRIELLVVEPDLPGASVTEVAPPTAGGSATLRSVLDTSQGQLVTNTTVIARWRVTYPDGSAETGPATTVTYADTRFSWHTLAGSVVRIHWYQGNDAFGRQAASLGDGAIEKAARLLGVSVTQPIDFFIYADQGAFSEALGPGAHENVAGEAHPEIRTMFGLITPDEIGTSEVTRVVAHELTHLVFDTATRNPYHEPLHWLNEGVAVYLSQGFDSTDRGLVSAAVRDRTVMPLASLIGNWPSDYDRFSLAYAEAVSAVDYIIRTHGQAALVTLIRSYSRGLADDEAFKGALGVDTRGFDTAWLASIGASQPTRYGPQPAPPGRTPAGWTDQGASASNGDGSSASQGPNAPALAAAPGATPASTSDQGASTSGVDGVALPVAVVLLLVVAALLLLRGRHGEVGRDPKV